MAQQQLCEEVDVEQLLLLSGDRACTARRTPPGLLALVGLVAFLGCGRQALRLRQTGEDGLHSKSNYVKVMKLFQARAANSSSILHGEAEVARAQAAGLVPKVHYPDFNDLRELRKFWNEHAQELRSGKESRTDKYLQVSVCITSISHSGLNLASAILSLEASISVCPKVALFENDTSQATNGHWKKQKAAARRLSTEVVFSASVPITSKTQALFSCVSNINSIIASLAAVIDSLTTSITSCPDYLNLLRDHKLLCTGGISGMVNGIAMTAADLSGITYQCRDPKNSSATEPIDPTRQGVVTAACVVSIGQAVAVLADIGLSISSVAKFCQRPDIETNFSAQALCVSAVGGHFNDIASAATFLAAAANGCGIELLESSGCAARVSGVFAGLASIIEASGAVIAHCSTPLWTTTLPPRSGQGPR